MPWHDIIGYSVQAGIGLGLLWVGRRLNQIHVLVNSRMTEALSEISWLKDKLQTANEEVGKHDA